MSQEMYDNLKEMFSSFFNEQQELIEKKDCENYKDDNENQNYNERINILDSRIKTLSAVINTFEECNKMEETKEDINKRLQVLDIQEKERQRIARDLHDSSLQNLTHLIHKVELCSKYMDVDLIKSKLELASISKNLKSVIQEVRNVIFDLRPMCFDDLGLKDSLERLVENVRESSDFIIQSEIDDIKFACSMIQINIYRIVEECINNAVKHSCGNRISFSFKKSDDNMCSIIVSDNGNSFDCKKILSVQDRHFGFCILNERVELLSGKMKIDSEPGVGTVINIAIPLFDK